MDYFSAIVLIIVVFIFMADRKIKSIEVIQKENSNILEEIKNVKQKLQIVEVKCGDMNFNNILTHIRKLEKEYLFIKNIEISKRNMLILSFLLITCMALFCFLVGGSYHFHRVGIAFTFAYFIFKFFIQKNRITKILSIILLVVGITISLLNWFITAIPEPSSFFRIFRVIKNRQNL